MLGKPWLIHDNLETLPIAVYFKVNETKEPKHLIIRGNQSEKEADDCYFNIMDEKIRIFGINESYEKSLTIKKKLRTAEINFALTGNRTYLNFVDMHKKELELFNKEQQDEESRTKGTEDSFKLISTVQKYIGVRIDPQKYSSKLFFHHIDMMHEEHQKYEASKLK